MTPAFRPDATASLLCRHLTLAQQVAIWFVRRAFDAGVEATERTARKVFRSQPVEQALDTLDALTEALHQSPLDTPPVHPLRDRMLTHEEFDLLTVLAVVQHAHDSAAGMIERWGWPAASDVGRVSEMLTKLATHFDDAGHRLPCPRSRPVMAATAVDTVAPLDGRERLLIEGIRLWVQLAERGEAPLPRLDSLMHSAGLGGAPALDAILTHTSSAATRPLDVRHRGCTGLSADEARIVHAISSAQRRRRETVFELLSSWLQPAAVRATLPAVEAIAGTLAASRHRLPLRDWHFPETAGQAVCPAFAPPSGATTH
jgi:hypothetical protein